MGKMVTLTIDNRPVTVPEGMNLVDAAKSAGIDIPIFCHHPKLKPAGMCRMCLVEIGRPEIDSATKQFILKDDGTLKIRFFPKLETACTTPVSEGMAVITESEKVAKARREVLELLLTSHPLDCPVCDKGGECPLQNLTMQYGPPQSRFLFDEKMKLAKHYPLGELIYLDRERCIQCGRCVRFQNEIVNDPVIALSQRGRSLQIITNSEPGFDSIFSGNSTDICPVGALTTADFRFGARPWELKPGASICNHCPVGCNITFNIRREAMNGGHWTIKRVMPRQNESVNEIWTCDKGRLVYQYLESDQRLTSPLIRKNGKLEEASWQEALDLITDKMITVGYDIAALASGRLSNEDLFNLKELVQSRGGQAILYSHMAGGDQIAQMGVGEGTDFSTLGPETAILVIASDLHQEAPIWWLRLKNAARNGVKLIVANPRPTRLDEFATHIVRYQYGQEAAVLSAFEPGGKGFLAEVNEQAAREFAEASNAILFFGSEGIGLLHSEALARCGANLMYKTGHWGKPNNGLIGVWPHGNTQGAWDMGFKPCMDMPDLLCKAKMIYIAGADPCGDDPKLAEEIQSIDFVVVQDLFLTATAKIADVVLPVLPYTEREGTYTSGDRRVQRFYPVLPPRNNIFADFSITAKIGHRMGLELEEDAAALVFSRIASTHPGYGRLTYRALAEVEEQWPIIGRSDLYYGGTSYENHQGTGCQLKNEIVYGEHFEPAEVVIPDPIQIPGGTILVVPVTKLFDHGNLMQFNTLLDKRKWGAELLMNPDLAENYGLQAGEVVSLDLGKGGPYPAVIKTDGDLPTGAALLPRSCGIPHSEPRAIKLIKMMEKS